MNAINIKGLSVTARHGVLHEEKVNAQPFVFDIGVDCDISAAALSDDVRDTVNYAEVCALVTSFCENNSFNLIEKLAYGAAYKICENFPLVKAAEVTVHKPEAPVGLPFGDISVSARVERNVVILSLGSSEGDRKGTLDGAIEALNALNGINVLKVSQYIETEPYGGAAKNAFLNCALTAECLLSPRGLLENIRKIESGFGRVRKERWGDRTLDIDIVFFGNKIIAEEGLSVPHPDYQNRPFVINPVKEIASGFVCPLTRKRMSDL